MQSVNVATLQITPSQHAFYALIAINLLFNAWLCSFNLTLPVLIGLSTVLWAGVCLHVWLRHKQESLQSIEVGTQAILRVNGIQAADWHISPHSRQFWGMIWLVVSSVSQQKTYKQLVMQDSFESEIQWRQLRTIVRYMHAKPI